MDELIKKIRAFLGLSQEKFGEKLGVTFATINRWENGRAEPNKLAQLKLYEISKELNVPVFDMTLERIKEEAESIKNTSERIVLYHGSKSGLSGPIRPISRALCDYGKGFYMGTDPLQPLTLISDYEKSRFYIVSVSLEGKRTLEVPQSLDWALLIAYNRGRMGRIRGTALYEKYRSMAFDRDFVIGNIADDRMFYVLDNFFQGNITDLALIKSLSSLQIGKQYAALTQAGCDAVRIEKEIPVSYLEKRFLLELSQTNREKGVRSANEICRDSRREGLFFDEILLSAEEK